MRDSENQAQRPGLFFAGTFLICVISVAALLAHIPDARLTPWRDLTMWITKALGGALGLNIAIKDDILSVNGFAMRIIRQCTALEYVVILSTAMLLYLRHSLSYRLIGVAIAVPTVLFANACRLIVTGLVGAVSQTAFDFVHDYLWVIAFALMVFGVWTLWVNGRFSISGAAVKRIAVILAVSIASYAALLCCRDAYGDLMARISSFFYRLMSGDPQATIVRIGDTLVYIHDGTEFILNTLLEQVDIAVYAGLMMPLQKRGDWEMAGMTLLGFATIVVISAIIIALGCAQEVHAGGMSGFIAVESIVYLALPIAVYWVMANEKNKRDSLAQASLGSSPPAAKRGKPKMKR